MVTRSTASWLAGGALLVALLSSCSATPATTPASQPPPSTMAPASPMASTADQATLTLMMADTSLGPVLVDGKGMTLYLYTKDSPNKSVCEGQCLAAWPALLGKPMAGAGVDDSKLGTLTRSNGSTQASYNGWPLYYWVKDTKPGDVTGQNVNAVWFVLDRDGDAVKK
ncbi:MAG: hypothetical protein WAU30_02165 [Propionicimonas sp.]